jgi:tetratricopeptide (TPR) repeat protein
MVAIAHTAAASVACPDGTLRLPRGLPPSAVIVSENDLRRRLGVLSPPPPVVRGLGADELQKVAGLTATLIACLALFDVLEPEHDRFGYRDLVAAREIGRLLGGGVAFGRILEAALALRRRGIHIAEARLAENLGGELGRDVAGRIAELNGQLAMPLERGPGGLDAILAAAERAEEEDDLKAAESLYATAMRADPTDPVLPFNLGNVFDAQGRTAEAKIAWQLAAKRDPAFAEAWYNLALTAEEEEEPDRAVAFYRRAIQAQPDYPDACFYLGLLLTRLDRFPEALPVLERLVALEPGSQRAVQARRAAALCRIQMRSNAARAG